ncbi:MAG: phosphoribosylformylglycinamidine synthase subunit PurS [Tuberibacillus sp.]
MKKVKVYVTLKESVLDPQGKAVEGAMHRLGYQQTSDVRIGKFIEFGMTEEACTEENIQEICAKLLANTVIEDFRYEVEEAGSL